MTPGAWKKQEGYTYKLAEDAPAVDPAATQHEMERRHSLDRLRAALLDLRPAPRRAVSAEHQPAGDPRGGLAVPDPSDMKYLYTPGLTADRGAGRWPTSPASSLGIGSSC